MSDKKLTLQEMMHFPHVGSVKISARENGLYFWLVITNKAGTKDELQIAGEGDTPDLAFHRAQAVLEYVVNEKAKGRME